MKNEENKIRINHLNNFLNILNMILKVFNTFLEKDLKNQTVKFSDEKMKAFESLNETINNIENYKKLLKEDENEI